MKSLGAASLKESFNRLLRRCRDWILRLGRFSPFGNNGEEQAAVPKGDGRWIWDPDRQAWLLEKTYTFRSLEWRLQIGEAETPPGVRSLRRILENRP